MTNPLPRVLVAGVSVRSIARSAIASGYDVLSADGYGDRDLLEPAPGPGRHLTVSPFAPGAIASHVTMPYDAVAYTSNFENYPEALEQLTAGRIVLGNAAAVLRDVRHAERVHDVLEANGLSSPAVYGAARDAVMHAPGRQLLAKPRRSGGGSGVRQWHSADPLLDGELLQEWVEGVSASLVFVADGHDARTLGVTRQLIGDGAFGATGHRWCGNLLGNTGAPVLDAQDDVIASATAAAQALTRAFGLRGINGIDFIARNGEAVVNEVNPRWTAAVELVERSLGISLFAPHVAASEGALTQVPQPETRGVFGKAVVFAPNDCTIPDTDSWLADEMIRDIPFPGMLVRSGAPICTVFAAAETAGACYADLSERARGIVQAIA